MKHVHNGKKANELQVICAALSSPSKLRSKTGQLVKRKIADQGIVLDVRSQRNLTRRVLNRKKIAKREELGGADPRTYGGLIGCIQLFKKSSILRFDAFTHNTVYLCGDEYVVDEASGRVAIVLSTENLLLNAYRQQCTGQGVVIAMDTSYRYMNEGYGVLPIKVVDFSQTGHTVAYAIVSYEDEEAQTQVLRMLKKEVESVVRSRFQKGMWI